MSIILYEELLGKEKLYISQEPQVPVSLISSYIHNEYLHVSDFSYAFVI